MADAEVWRRRRAVTFARGAVVLAWLTVVAGVVAFSWSSDSSAAAHNPSFGEALATTLSALVVVPAVWCVPVGAMIDHHLSQFGAPASALIHAIGCTGAFVIIMTVTTIAATVSGNDIPQAFALLAMFLSPPTLALGFLLAMLVPGSFPRRPGIGMSGVVPAFRALAEGWKGLGG